MLEVEARRSEHRGHDALTGQHERGRLAERGADEERGRGRRRGAVHGSPDRPGQLGLSHGSWGDEVHRAGDVLAVEAVQQRRDLVVDVDPRDPLATRPHRAEHAEPRDAEELGERPAVAREDDPRAREDDTGAILGRRRLALPLHAHAGEEVVAGRCALVDGRLAAAVDADRGGVDEDARSAVAHRGGDTARRRHPAVEDAGASCGAPTPRREGLAREVHDRVGALACRVGERRSCRIPGRRRDADHLRRCSAQRDDLVAPSTQRDDEVRPEQPGRPDHRDPHRPLRRRRLEVRRGRGITRVYSRAARPPRSVLL